MTLLFTRPRRRRHIAAFITFIVIDSVDKHFARRIHAAGAHQLRKSTLGLHFMERHVVTRDFRNGSRPCSIRQVVRRTAISRNWRASEDATLHI